MQIYTPCHIFEVTKAWFSNVKIADEIAGGLMGPPGRLLLPVSKDNKQRLDNLLKNL